MPQGQVRLLTVLVAFLAIVGSVWLFGGAADPDERAWDPAAEEPVWLIATEDIDLVDVVLGDQTVTVEQKNGVLRMKEPVAARMSPSRGKAFIDDLVDLKLGIRIPGGEPIDYGLDVESRGLVKVTLKSGEIEELWVGHSAPIGWRTYVQRPGGQMMVVPGRLRDTIFGDPRALRDTALLRFDLSQAQSATIISAAGTLSVYLEDGRWWVRGFGRANLDKVDELFVGLANLRMEGWDDGVVDGPIEGALFDVSVILKNGDRHGFQVGPNMPGGRLVRTHNGLTGHIRNEPLAMLNQGPNYVGDPNGLPISMTETVKIAVKTPKRELLLTRGGESWALNEKLSGDSLLDKLTLVKAHYRALAVPELLEPFTEVRIVDHSGATRVVQVGAERVDGKWYAAQEGPDRYRYLIDAVSWDEALLGIAAPE